MPDEDPDPAPSARERERLERAARRHELGRPPVTEHEIGQRTYVVAQVEPLDVDGVRTVAIGTALWLVAALGLLPFVGTLNDNGRLSWLWTCIAGFGLGLLGLEYCRLRRKALLRQPHKRRAETSRFGAAGG
ncbi:MAG: DUF2530 domain-containing protein [Nocardioidaceae bacterium]